MARICFGDKKPLGQVLQYDANTPLRVTGVMKDVPDNSTLRFQYVIPLSFLLQRGSTFDRWDQFQLSAFIRLAPGAEARAVNAKFEKIIEKHLTAFPSKVILIPLSKLHLYGIDGKGPITYVILFSIVALFILLIAGINFINLTTARSAQRAREVGLRKVIGARRADLIMQFLGETVIHSGFALLCALGLVLAFLPAFNTLSGKAFQAADVFGPAILPAMAAIAVFAGLLSGIYPALFLSGFQPIRTLRGTFGGARNSGIRRILVVVQFSISAILLAGTLVVSKQLQFIRNMNLGFETDNLVLTRMDVLTREAFEALKADLKQNPGIAAVTRSNTSLTLLGFETAAINWEGRTDDRKLSIQIRTVDFDYLEAMGMSMKEGRFFSKEFAADATEGFILNETAVHSMGMPNPLGKAFDLNGTKGRIIGVVRDFYHHSLHEAIEPLIFCMNIDAYSTLFVRLTPGRTAAGLDALKANWSRINPGYPFSYSFFADTLADLYRTERQTGDFVRTFAALAVLIACFGLFGLAAFLAERKTKEIGIRKVAGASVSRIVVLLNKEFLKWVFIADLIGLPIAYFFLHQWLRSFAYRTAIGPGVFGLAAGLSLGIAGLTVSFQSIKAGRANPIDALKFE
jgi:ABC-type antimicrobial peptide transport system permease subunit